MLHDDHETLKCECFQTTALKLIEATLRYKSVMIKCILTYNTQKQALNHEIFENKCPGLQLHPNFSFMSKESLVGIFQPADQLYRRFYKHQNFPVQLLSMTSFLFLLN